MNRFLNDKQLAIFLIMISSILAALGQIAWKIGSARLAFDFSLLVNYSFWLGCFLYGFGFLFMVLALKFGNLSLVHPFLSLGFIWAALMAFFYLGESFSAIKMIAILVIILGAFFVSRGDVI